MSKLKIFLASINANKLIAELEKDPATLNINDEVLPNHLEDLLETLKGDDTVKTLKIESSVWNSASLLSHNGITEESKIELLKAIPKMNLNALGLTGLTLNNSDIDIFCEAIKHSKINELEFFLGREISNESKAKLFTSIKNNKALLNCLVTGPNDMSPQEKQEKKTWTSQINERTDKNQSILEEVAQVLKDWSETPNNLHKGTIHSYLKLYQKLNKDSVIEELEKLKVTDANFILENADKHINEHFFEMVGIAKEVYADGLFVPTDITSYIASCIGDLSNIINKSSDIES